MECGATARCSDAPGASQCLVTDPRRQPEDSFAEMQGMAFGYRWHLTPIRVKAELPGFGVFDPLVDVRAPHGLILKARFSLACRWRAHRDLGHIG